MEEDAVILRLPDSCLRHIFLQLDTDDYEQLRQVCRRFEPLVIACWRTKYKHWTRKYTGGDYAAKLKWVLHNLSDFLEELNLDYLNDEELRLFENVVFPNIKSLKAGSHCGENDTEILLKAFPNITKLSLDGNIDLEIVSQMRDLTELSCYIYGHKKPQTFRKIFAAFKLQKLSINYASCEATRDTRGDFIAGIQQCAPYLKELMLEARLLDWIIPQLDELPQLQTIALINSEDCDERVMFERITRQLGARVRTLVSERLCEQFAIEELAAMNVCNLERWISKDRNLRWGDGDAMHVAFSQLRELQLLGDYIHGRLDISDSDDDEDDAPLPAELMFVDYDPLPIIAACTRLELLAVPREWINVRLKLDALSNVLRQSNNRKLPLELRCLETDDRRGRIFGPLEYEVDAKLLRITRANYPEEFKCIRSCCLSFQIVLER